MVIDWFTIGAQALNFLILVWLLKRFLYKPILHAIDAREKRIAAELADADAKKAEAQKERDQYQHKNEEFDQQRAALLTKATDEAKSERQRLLDAARKAADALSAKRQETLRDDAHSLSQAVSRRTQQEVFAIARKALGDLASTGLEERLVEIFTRRLREMNGKAKECLAGALKAASAPALVRSAFDLPGEQRATIQKALNETFSADIHVRFETAPDLIAGIELTTNGQKLAWSIADYLALLEKSIGELLKEKDKPEPKVEAKPEAKVEPKPQASTQPKPEATTDVKPGTEAEPKPTPDAVVAPKSEAEVEPKPPAKAKPELQAKAEPKPEVKAESKPKPAAEAAPEPATKPATQADAKAEPKLDAKLASTPPAGAEPKPVTKATPQPKVEAEPAPKASVASEPEAKIAPKPGAKAEARPEAEPKSESKAAPEPGPHTAPAPENS